MVRRAYQRANGAALLVTVVRDPVDLLCSIYAMWTPPLTPDGTRSLVYWLPTFRSMVARMLWGNFSRYRTSAARSAASCTPGPQEPRRKGLHARSGLSSGLAPVLQQLERFDIVGLGCIDLNTSKTSLLHLLHK